MIQNFLLTSFTPLKNTNEVTCWENRPFSTVWPENNRQKKRDVTITIKKKQKRVRTAFSTDQLQTLEKAYSRHRYINSEERAELANALKISDRCVKIWFQNRRMKEKKESSQSRCDSPIEPVSIESPSVPASPPLQVIIDQKNGEHSNQVTHYHEPTYHLHTYGYPSPVQSGYGVMAPPGFSTYFRNENTVYSTQYYPYDVNNSNGEGSEYNQVNNYWAANEYPYNLA